MSGSRMKIAGRFKPCVHMGCFDLEVFVEMNQRSRKVKSSETVHGLSYFFLCFKVLNEALIVSAVAMPHMSQKLCTGEYHY